jgi:hypothetical protein
VGWTAMSSPRSGTSRLASFATSSASSGRPACSRIRSVLGNG